MTWITTDNVPAEAWRYLLEYANQELALDAIIKRHGKPTKKALSNYKKQAQQLRATILQAKEYFNAAQSSSLITSPNHLYYGMVSLCSAIMLLLGDGDKSLDRLRQNKRNNHHGLDFSTSVNSANCGVGLDILENSTTTIRDSGFFHQWYSVLPTTSPVYSVVKYTSATGQQTITHRQQVGTTTHINIDKLVGFKSSILDLLKYMPDLNFALREYGVGVPSSRVDHESFVTLKDKVTRSIFKIHGTHTEEDLQLLLDQFILPERVKETLKIQKEGTSCIVSYSVIPPDIPDATEKFTFPSYRETINNEHIGYGVAELDRPELIDAYLSAYGLSMLSRYFPDVWVSCLDSHCKAAKLIERLIFVLLQKAPGMALAALRSDDFVISTHRPAWY